MKCLDASHFLCMSDKSLPGQNFLIGHLGYISSVHFTEPFQISLALFKSIHTKVRCLWSALNFLT